MVEVKRVDKQTSSFYSGQGTEPKFSQSFQAQTAKNVSNLSYNSRIQLPEDPDGDNSVDEVLETILADN